MLLEFSSFGFEPCVYISVRPGLPRCLVFCIMHRYRCITPAVNSHGFGRQVIIQHIAMCLGLYVCRVHNSSRIPESSNPDLALCRAPLNKPNGWLFWGILGVAAAPVVVGACATLVSAVGYEVLYLC